MKQIYTGSNAGLGLDVICWGKIVNKNKMEIALFFLRRHNSINTNRAIIRK